jgi:hypothetical protein
MVCAVLGLCTLCCVGAGVRRWGLALSIGPKLSRFHLKMETESSLRNVVFLNKNRTVDNVQEHNIYINLPSSQSFRSCTLHFVCDIADCSPLLHPSLGLTDSAST